MKFNDLLQELDLTLKQFNLRNYQKLYESLPDESINYFLHLLGIENDKFKLLFQWKNGFDFDEEPQQDCQLFDYGVLLSLEAIKEKVNVNKSLALWDSSFIPLITDGTGQYILFNNKQGSNYGKLYLYSASLLFVRPIGYYDSIDTLIETTIKGYQQGALKYDFKEDWLHMDIDQYHTIASQINRKSERWSLS